MRYVKVAPQLISLLQIVLRRFAVVVGEGFGAVVLCFVFGMVVFLR